MHRNILLLTDKEQWGEIGGSIRDLSVSELTEAGFVKREPSKITPPFRAHGKEEAWRQKWHQAKNWPDFVKFVWTDP